MKRPDKQKNLLDTISTAIGSGNLVYSSHANQRMHQRGIIKPEVEYVLENGHHEAKKINLMKDLVHGITQLKEQRLTEESCESL